MPALKSHDERITTDILIQNDFQNRRREKLICTRNIYVKNRRYARESKGSFKRYDDPEITETSLK